MPAEGARRLRERQVSHFFLETAELDETIPAKIDQLGHGVFPIRERLESLLSRDFGDKEIDLKS